MSPLFGLVVIVIGFAARLNPLMVVVVSAVITGVCGGMSPVAAVSAFGKAFNDNRFVSVVWLVLPLMGLLERYGLQARARERIGRLRAASAGRLLMSYLAVRQLSAALGLTSIGGQATMVRPLIAPMAESAAETRLGPLPTRAANLVRAHAAAADNIGLFFGEDVFIAIGSILLIRGFLQQSGIDVAPLRLSAWAIPTAAATLLVHGARLLRLDQRLRRAAMDTPAP